MYNILLTDDEQIMVDSLTFILNKNFSEQVQIFSATSGTEALEIVAKNQIDIIFMDINMPGLNGLETVRYIMHSKPETVVIILSAFDEFQYAQEAVSLGAFKYLTKPVNRNTVIDTVREAMSAVDKKRGQLSNEVELHKKLDLVSPMVESDFIYSAAFGGDNDVSDYFSYFEIEDCVWCFCCLEIPNAESKKLLEIYTKIRSILTPKTHCIIGSFMMNRIAIFFYFPSKMYKNGDCSVITENIKSLYNLLSIQIKSGIRAGVSKIEVSPAATGSAYNKALEMLNSAPEQGGIIFADEWVGKQEKKSGAGEIAEKIFARIRAGDAGGLQAFIGKYFEALQKKYDNIDKIKNSLFELIVNARNIATEVDASYHNESFDNAFSILSKENDMSKLELFVRNLCTESAATVLEASSRAVNPIIEKASAFISQHLSENISLEDTAQAVNVSAFYLSKLFKEEKNVNYVTYVSDARMEKACSLLKDNSLSIKEISAEVGFNDQNYFSRTFRNKFGMTPTEFRDAAQK